MHPLEEHILRQLRETGMATPGGLLVAGVSGGADSVALLHLLAAVAEVDGVIDVRSELTVRSI
ncbi:MAG: hypothetical protein RQ753_04240 [Desulfurivibrionaceae bacterium]|nr:hypothetical protein [Desulfurivibrionaceae bacterium]